MKRVFVCAGMGLAKSEKINNEAKMLGEILAENNEITYVQGGSDKGLMGKTLKEFLKHSKNVEFLIPDVYYEYDAPALIKLVGKENFKATITRGEAGRLQAIKGCDLIIVLPGGTGTLEELLYCNETSRSGEHKTRIILVNIDGYYNGFLKQLETNFEEGLSRRSAIRFDTISSVEALKLNKYSFGR